MFRGPGTARDEHSSSGIFPCDSLPASLTRIGQSAAIHMYITKIKAPHKVEP